ncbi:hypothetical protein ACFL4L_02615 [bacterium]
MKGYKSYQNICKYIVQVILIIFLPNMLFASGVRSPLEAQLYLSNPLRPNDNAILTCIITSEINAPNTKLIMELTNNLSLINGNLEWRGDISAKDTIEVVIKIKAIKSGLGTVSAKVKSVIDEKSWLSDIDHLYLYIDLEEPAISRKVLFPKDWTPTTTGVKINVKDRQIINKPFRGPKKPVSNSMTIIGKNDGDNNVAKGNTKFQVRGYYYYTDPDNNLRPLRFSRILIFVEESGQIVHTVLLSYTQLFHLLLL